MTAFPIAAILADNHLRVKATSVNPIDIKVRKGVYDDAPDYYEKVAGLKPYHCIGFDGAGVVVEVGPDVQNFKQGDEVYYVTPTTRQGTNEEYQILPEMTVGRKPKSLDFVEAAALPLTYGTAYEALVERMRIEKGENVGLLIINGAGGVGAVASQIARNVLELPVVVTTASRPESIAFTKKMGATHVINHREDLRPQIKGLNLNVPIK
jgi:NADPH:quinone reductase-like Zn-dependent oxidoreductase